MAFMKPKTKTPTSKEDSSRISLKELAPETAKVVREYGTATTEEIATVVITKFHYAIENAKSTTTQDTIRRRIYDVINVLAASGMVDKVGKKITWKGAPQSIRSFSISNAKGLYMPSPEDQEIESRIIEKEIELKLKVGLLTLYKALIQRNFPEEVSTQKRAISLPIILICLQDPEDGVIYPLDENKTKVELQSQKDIIFQSPMDILKNMTFDPNSIHNLIQAASPDFIPYATDILQQSMVKQQAILPPK